MPPALRTAFIKFSCAFVDFPVGVLTSRAKNIPPGAIPMMSLEPTHSPNFTGLPPIMVIPVLFRQASTPGKAVIASSIRFCSAVSDIKGWYQKSGGRACIQIWKYSYPVVLLGLYRSIWHTTNEYHDGRSKRDVTVGCRTPLSFHTVSPKTSTRTFPRRPRRMRTPSSDKTPRSAPSTK